MKKTTPLSLLFTIALLSQHSYADTKSQVITDEDELRNITDTYRSDPERPKDFIPQGDGTVIDKRTGLQWMRCSLGQTWTGETCEGEPSEYTWEQADTQKIDFAGYSDWRLPKDFELQTLVFCTNSKLKGNGDTYKKSSPYDESACKYKPTISLSVFPTTKYWAYWTSTPAYSEDIGWAVFFLTGWTTDFKKSDALPVRLVRTPNNSK